jgi:fluoride ion exporter CrcB/FEX
MFLTGLVFLGGGIGSALRHEVNLAAARLLGLGFPYGTLTVNAVGSLAMGALAGYFAFKGEAAQPGRLFLTTGVLGAASPRSRPSPSMPRRSTSAASRGWPCSTSWPRSRRR